MGNLDRPGYRATIDGIWSYIYDACDYGILPNQSSPDGMSWLPGQRLSSCTCKGEDHPNQDTDRGAPKINVIKGSVGQDNRIGAATQRYQVAPSDIWYRPNYAFVQIPNYETTSINSYCSSPFQQAVSGTTMLNKKWYDGNQYQKYAFGYSMSPATLMARSRGSSVRNSRSSSTGAPSGPTVALPSAKSRKSRCPW
jgi:beta-glucan synthesis-associated protein KRE6